MRRKILYLIGTLVLSFFTLTAQKANAQCSDVILGLREPLGTVVTNQGNLLVSETGTAAELHSGRISIIDANGNRRTLLDGLPTAINDVNEPAGPNGIFMRGRTLYLAIGVGDVGRAGPFPGTTIPNPNPVSSQIFSSILGIQFSANTENTTTGFTMLAEHEQALANGHTVTLSNDAGETLRIRLVADFTNYVSNPLPTFPGNVQLSNPYGIVGVDDTLYVTDGGRNRVWQIDLLTGSVSTLVTFPQIPNPLFGIERAGGPFLDPVPTGIAVANGKLLVTLFRGVPFPSGTSTVQQIDRTTGTQSPYISGLKTAIDILPIEDEFAPYNLVLQHASSGTFFGIPGLVLRFDNPAAPPSVITNCLARPTSMTLDRKAGRLYVSEYGGRIVSVPYVVN